MEELVWQLGKGLSFRFWCATRPLRSLLSRLVGKAIHYGGRAYDCWINEAPSSA
ncbi:hypothetical protein QJS10_CPB11g00678 [Acorus calamus]|uniref:Uncharacterized protein n=1 Tax=Acorus calamus TaxID=4465 RepID=A0AAV9DV34_ACOCL|nr:hypothetical protein QJS10_CPB11g00678 [Acorus calamus]